VVYRLPYHGQFFTNVVEKQIDPWNDLYPEEWRWIEFGWNSIFIAELLWNAVGSFYFLSWPKNHFLRSSWNIFDVLVVSVSLPSMLGVELPGPMSQLRMLRAFRVFRLFKRIESLNKIISSLALAVPGIVNASIVMGLVMCIYAILAVDLFGRFGSSGAYMNVDGVNISLTTLRGLNYGDEYYGTFSRSIFTLFQVLTGESWSEVIARPIVFSHGPRAILGALFYISFILLCGIVLINVAVAVLLEKMVDSSASSGASSNACSNADGHSRQRAAAEHTGRQPAGPDARADTPDVTAAEDAPVPSSACETLQVEMIRQLQLEVARLRQEAGEREERLTAALNAVAASVAAQPRRRDSGSSRRRGTHPKADFDEVQLTTQAAALGIPVDVRPSSQRPTHIHGRRSPLHRYARGGCACSTTTQPIGDARAASPVVQGLIA